MDATLQAILAELFRASADVQKLLARIKELEAEVERLTPKDDDDTSFVRPDPGPMRLAKEASS